MLLPLVTSTLEELGLRQDPRIKINLGPGDIVHANEDATKQILRNIIENAAAHITPEGAVRISFSGSTLSIEDTGIGIPPSICPISSSVSTASTRLGTAQRFRPGLAIVKSMVEAQGGEVTVESTVGVQHLLSSFRKSENS
jgi:signal transduction histidine kinase